MASTATSVLVTGGAGFIGSDFVRMLVAERPDYRVVNLDLLTYAGNLLNVAECEGNPRYRFVRGDIRDRSLVAGLLREEKVRAIVNFAAETHVDRSILGPRAFVETNVLGTLTLLEAALETGVRRFVQISTDEVYGSLGPEGRFTESSPIKPSSPYSASKASADYLAMAFWKTFGLEVVITRCSNNYGPYQFPEKLIPLMILQALEGRELPVYGDGLYVRDWIYVRDHSRAVLQVLERGRPGEVYNIGAGCERTSLEVVRAILKRLDKPESLIRFVKDRPGHDRRYAIDPGKIRRELGWEPEVDFDTGLDLTVRWYREHQDWLRAVTSGEYRRFYERWYGGRLGGGPSQTGETGGGGGGGS